MSAQYFFLTMPDFLNLPRCNCLKFLDKKDCFHYKYLPLDTINSKVQKSTGPKLDEMRIKAKWIIIFSKKEVIQLED